MTDDDALWSMKRERNMLRKDTDRLRDTLKELWDYVLHWSERKEIPVEVVTRVQEAIEGPPPTADAGISLEGAAGMSARILSHGSHRKLNDIAKAAALLKDCLHGDDCPHEMDYMICEVAWENLHKTLAAPDTK